MYENFLREVVKSIIKEDKRECTEEMFEEFINDLMCDDEIFDSIDYRIREMLNENDIICREEN